MLPSCRHHNHANSFYKVLNLHDLFCPHYYYFLLRLIYNYTALHDAVLQSISISPQSTQFAPATLICTSTIYYRAKHSSHQSLRSLNPLIQHQQHTERGQSFGMSDWRYSTKLGISRHIFPSAFTQHFTIIH